MDDAATSLERREWRLELNNLALSIGYRRCGLLFYVVASDSEVVLNDVTIETIDATGHGLLVLSMLLVLRVAQVQGEELLIQFNSKVRCLCANLYSAERKMR